MTLWEKYFTNNSIRDNYKLLHRKLINFKYYVDSANRRLSLLLFQNRLKIIFCRKWHINLEYNTIYSI